jgi:hypothetical protein
MAPVFISFRSGDEPYGALLIQTVLAQRLGADRVFRSSDAIAPGDDYVHALVTAVRSSEIVLVVIGCRWLAPVDPAGRRAIDSPDDWVYRELAIAFAAGRRVVPVLLGAAPRMPAEHELPPRIGALARCQYRRLSHRQFWADIGLLESDLIRLVPSLGGYRQQATGNSCFEARTAATLGTEAAAFAHGTRSPRRARTGGGVVAEVSCLQPPPCSPGWPWPAAAPSRSRPDAAGSAAARF